MVHRTLKLSSLYCGAVQGVVVFTRRDHLYGLHGTLAMYWMGELTSVLNHSTTHEFYRWMDRIWVAVCTTLYCSNGTPEGWLIYASVSSFFYAKKTERVRYHVLAHLLVTMHKCYSIFKAE